MQRLLVVLVLAASMLGCASSVKLDSVPVEDRSTYSVATGDRSNGSTSVGQTSVAPVSLDATRPDNTLATVGHIVYFDYDSFVVRSEFQPIIEASAKLMKADQSRTLIVEGHTDERGGREYNLALGQKRADSVRRALSLLGVADSQMETVSFGKEKPVVTGDSEDAMSKNRRAEVNIR